MNFSQPIIQIIAERFSCRTYQGTPLTAELVDNLSTFAAEQKFGPLGGEARYAFVGGGAEDMNELKGLGTYGFIKGASGFIVGATADDEQHLEDYGYLLERIVLYATDLGLGTCWLGGTPRSETA